MTRTRLYILSALMMTGMLALPVAAQEPAAVAGAQDAIEAATELAAADAVRQAIENLPAGVDTLAVFPLVNDDDYASSAVLHEFRQQLQARGLKLLTREDGDWDRLFGEFKFQEDNIDLMPPDLLLNFRNVYPSAAYASGRLVYARMDDTELRAQAAIDIKIGVVTTGEIVGTGIGKATVPVEVETVALSLFMQAIRHPWIWPVVIVGVVAAIVILAIWIPLKRRLALATKPREVTKPNS